MIFKLPCFQFNRNTAAAVFVLPMLAGAIIGAGCNLPTAGSGPKPSPTAVCTPSISGIAAVTTALRPRSMNHGNYLNEPPAKPDSTQRLLGHVPKATRAARDLGALADSAPLDVTVSIPLNHVAELQRLVSALHDPSSPQYGQYLTPDQFAERFGPTPEQAAQVQSYLESQGFRVTSIASNRKLVHASGTHRAAAQAFATELHHYADSQGRAFVAPKYEVELPAGIPIEAVHGLHNLSLYRAHAHERALNLANPLTTGSGPNGGVSPADLRSAYRFPSTSSADGSGQTLALFELDGYKATDITHYEQTFGLPNVPLSNVLVDHVTGKAGAGAGEVTLDIELMIAAAPAVSKLYIYEGPNSDAGVIDTYNRIATDNLAKSVSTSWGQSEDQSPISTLQAENSIFMQFAAQGQTLYAAAGDSGAYDNGSTVSVDDPGTQPYVVSVGGTRLSTDGGGNYLSETTWNNGTPAAGAGGGGVSGVWTIPSYQSAVAAVAPANSKVSKTMRNVPDVSLDSDPQSGYAIYYAGKWTIFGGTSCAAPIWAGFTALVNQARASHGLNSLGLAHTVLYPIATQPSAYAADFNDIQDGSSNLYFPTVAGFDNATGLGTLRADGLLSDLAQVPRPAVPPPATPIISNPGCAP